MVVAVAETAIANGSAGRVKTKSSGPSRRIAKRVMRHAALAALTLLGLSPALSIAQIVPSGAHAPGVISTANGLPQVNIQKPSGAGVSLNTYSQFDVSHSGAILNNSSVITSTQLAGQISGNPNFGANDAAKIIVNQVNSNNPSQLRGYIEVAGKKADVVVANPSGIVVDGGGFINTSRGILTTGKQVKSSSASTTVLNQGSTISADAVSISSGNDINVAGSTIVGTNDVSLVATHDVNITTTQDTSQTSTTYQEKRTGLGTSGLTLTVGTNKLATTDNESSTTNNGSVVGSLDGNLSIQAGSTLHVTGSDLVAAKDVTGTAANVIIDAATDTAHSAHTQEI